MRPTYESEYSLAEQGYTHIIGIDEAGRGALVHSVAVASVLVPVTSLDLLYEANDSKKLSPKKRVELYSKITDLCDWCVVLVDHKTVDKINVLNATKKGVVSLMLNYVGEKAHALIDGNMKITNAPIEYTSIIKGDCKSISIACASIIAKVTRDAEMSKIAKEYPQFGFDRNKGYGTKEHLAAIKLYGPCPYHRKTFRGVKEYLEVQNVNS